MNSFYKKIRLANFCLILINLALLSYTLLNYIVPELNFLFVKASDQTYGIVYESKLARSKNIPEDKLKAPPSQNKLIIPSIFVNGEINEGENKSTLNRGIWLRPNASKPDEGGNTVLTAHRFLFKNGPNTFYHLDKLKIGEPVLVFWEKKEYNYSIIDIFEVLPDDTYIEKSTEENILTLYTCTPLFTSEKRLVIKAKLVE